MLRAQSDAQILRQSFGIWAASERSRLLSTVRDTRLTRECLVRWIKKRHDVERLEGMCDRLKLHVTLSDVLVTADLHHDQTARRTLHSSFSRWRDRLGHRQNQLLQADLVYESKIRGRALQIWQTAAKRLQTNAAIAHNAEKYFKQRTVLRCWKAAFEQKKRDHWLDNRRQADLRALFDRKPPLA